MVFVALASGTRQRPSLTSPAPPLTIFGVVTFRVHASVKKKLMHRPKPQRSTIRFKQAPLKKEEADSTARGRRSLSLTPDLIGRHLLNGDGDGGGSTTDTHLPLCGTEHAVNASADHNDSLHLVHLGLHQTGLDGLQDPVLHLVVPRHLKSVRNDLLMSTSGKRHEKIRARVELVSVVQSEVHERGTFGRTAKRGGL